MFTLTCFIRLPWCQEDVSLVFPSGKTISDLRAKLADTIRTQEVVLVNEGKILQPEAAIDRDMQIKIIPQVYGG